MSDANSILRWFHLGAEEDSSNIFYGCLTTILASTYLALHLNIPPPYPAVRSSRTFLQRWYRSRMLWELRRQLSWILALVIAPELLVSFAFGDWRAARLGLSILHEKGRGNVRDWTMAHAHFANMGGLVFSVQHRGSEVPDAAPFKSSGGIVVLQEITDAVNLSTVKQLQNYLGAMGSKIAKWIKRVLTRYASWPWSFGLSRSSRAPHQEEIELDNLAARDASVRNSPPERTGINTGQVDVRSSGPAAGSRHSPDSASPVGATEALPEARIQLHLNVVQVVAAQVLGVLGEVPQIDMDGIEARSKVNPLIKAIAAVRLLWVFATVIIQGSINSSLTQIELSTFTYVLCALVSYVLYWSKPQGVEEPDKHIVAISDGVRPVTDQDIKYIQAFGGSPFLLRNFVPPFGMDNLQRHPTECIPTDISLTSFAFFGPSGHKVFFGDSDVAGVLVGMIFGGLYCLGWNHSFPSLWEVWLWRASAIVITGSLIPFSLANAACTIAFSDLTDRSKPLKTHNIHVLVLYFLLALYVFCRFFMLFEMFRTLFI
ncbi:hypothetical protein GGS23DRAFT_312562 [Durotheca rogersii]|uniref:uncharacterized protein n=1 Tax=Durotheca rogersii TaxID=419775 RepID=UPI0022205700|nr:uncharacterized protein GGS23DRAFT_312562 [Durotheca rogersii]KAI5859544.1 hypothetical protein GGS23DRAFT_312562 [Durotheca rogersii]